MSKLKFIDLFAGLGGFHLALEELGHECVFASELQPNLRELYKTNFPDTPIFGDITKIPINEIPQHDILCAGFPCQPFSQAGKRLGFAEDRGNLFNYIADILGYHRPKYIILENVKNLKNHDNGNTWKVIHEKLSKFYDVRETILSPHQFGIPQHRFRIYIVGVLKNGVNENPLISFSFPEPSHYDCDIKSVVNENSTDYLSLKKETRIQLSVWQDFLDILTQNNVKVPTFPVWAMEFGATYEFEETPPAYQDVAIISKMKGKFGRPINGTSIDECLMFIPKYSAGKKEKRFPEWKIQFIKQNRLFYEKNKEILNNWLYKIMNLENSHQKFEWNCGFEKNPTIQNKIVQFRPSGIRVKRPTYSPALVLTSTQIPIFPWVRLPSSDSHNEDESHGRYMTIEEAALLQGMQRLKKYPETIPMAFKAFGNAVNVDIVKMIAKNLISHEHHKQSFYCITAECL